VSKAILHIRESMAKYFGPVVRWVSEEHVTAYRLIKLLILSVPLLMIISVFELVVGLVTIHFPHTCTFLMLACLIGPPVLLILAVLIPKNSMRILQVGFALSFALGAIVLGTFAFTRTPWPNAIRTRLFSNNVQFPLGRVEGIAVDSDGFIYLAINAYSRVQKYSSEGEFMHGWYVDAGTGPFGIWAADEDNDTIHALIVSGRMHEVYDSDGTFLGRSRITSPEEFRAVHKRARATLVADAGGIIYQIESSSWSPKVTKITPDAKKATVITDSFYRHLVRAPRPAFDLMFIALLMGALHGGLLTLKRSRFRYVGRVAADAERDDRVTGDETVTHVADNRRVGDA